MIVIAESLARVIAAFLVTSTPWQSCLVALLGNHVSFPRPQNRKAVLTDSERTVLIPDPMLATLQEKEDDMTEVQVERTLADHQVGSAVRKD